MERRIRLARARYHRLKRELYDMEDAPCTLCMLNAEVIETLVMWSSIGVNMKWLGAHLNENIFFMILRRSFFRFI